MIIRKLSLTFLFALAMIDSAQAQQQALVIVARGTLISPSDVAVLLGRPLGVAPDLHDCGDPDDPSQIFNVVLVGPDRGGSTQSNLIVTVALEPLHSGARLTRFDGLGACFGPDGLLYDRYRVDVESRNGEPLPSVIDFIVPADTSVTSGTGLDVGVILGRPLGTVNALSLGDCGDHGSFPIHNVVLTRPAAGHGSDVTPVIVTAANEPMSPGTRLEGIQALGLCTVADGSDYTKYRATAHPVAAKP